MAERSFAAALRNLDVLGNLATQLADADLAVSTSALRDRVVASAVWPGAFAGSGNDFEAFFRMLMCDLRLGAARASDAAAE